MQDEKYLSSAIFDTVAVTAQDATDTLTAVSGSNLDARKRTSLSYTLKIATQNVRWSVFAANSEDYSDEAVVQAEATVTAGSVGTYSVAPAPFGFYRIKMRTAVAGVVGSATIAGLAKK
jgi:hypothetical protein